MRSVLLAFVAVFVLNAAAGCSMQRRADDVIPVRNADVRRALAGSWEILDDDGAVAGAITFEGDRFTADTATNRLFGSWSVVDYEANAHTVALQVDGYDEGGVQEIYGDPDHIELTLVFATQQRLYALQPASAWTQWVRRPAAAESATVEPASAEPVP